MQSDTSPLQSAGLHALNSLKIFAFQTCALHSDLLANHFQRQACIFQSWDPYAVTTIHPTVLYNIFGYGNGNKDQMHQLLFLQMVQRSDVHTRGDVQVTVLQDCRGSVWPLHLILNKEPLYLISLVKIPVKQFL